MKASIRNTIIICLLSTGLHSCQKAEYINSFSEFVDVYFDADKTALRDNGAGVFIGLRYNGYPSEWDASNKKIRVVPGEGKFEFYDTRDGKVVAEKVIDVKPGTKETFTLFQPTMDAPVAFIDPKEQDAETPAPAGHIKVKLANYAQDLIPFERLDLKVSISYYDADWNEVVKEIGAIKDVKNSVDKAEYHILPDGLPNPLPEIPCSYVFEFVDSDTGQPLLNHGGTNYSNMAFSPSGIDPLPVKNIFTLYMISRETWGEAPPFIKKGDTFYEIATNILFAD
ncbi:hypothetical protein [Sphingobacterium sp. SYP-B4668]|uniref:hypothetical protein n=1 Tax=Sphingobacterium sp. SYP-B4668 TaxID=2996035 RepID=UPI0022DD2E9B|nr:hypothetical protein [Sphingobacterium sp. SYP-B4668]